MNLPQPFNTSPRRVHRKRKEVTAVSPPPPPPAPTVVNVFANTEDNSLVVTFDQPVTWDGVGAGTLTTSVGGGTWVEQQAADVIKLAADGGVTFLPDTGWEWTGPDGSLSPVPDDSQTGVCT
jgi:hypothetical protein